MLADWLGHQMALWNGGLLPATRQAQLRALGAALGAEAAAASSEPSAAVASVTGAASPSRTPARRKATTARKPLAQQA